MFFENDSSAYYINCQMPWQLLNSKINLFFFRFFFVVCMPSSMIVFFFEHCSLFHRSVTSNDFKISWNLNSSFGILSSFLFINILNIWWVITCVERHTPTLISIHVCNYIHLANSHIKHWIIRLFIIFFLFEYHLWKKNRLLIDLKICARQKTKT